MAYSFFEPCSVTTPFALNLNSPATVPHPHGEGLLSLQVSTKNIPVESLLDTLPAGARVIDLGCLGWRLMQPCLTRGLLPSGADIGKPAHIPEHASYYSMHLSGQVDAPAEWFDLTVASHVLEHMQEVYRFVHSMMRITRPGGYVWIEALSELSLGLSEHSPVEFNEFESFYTDPTHLRPLPPGAMYRLALANYLVPLAIARCEQHFGQTPFPCTRMLARKPLNVPAEAYLGSRYVSLRGSGLGLAAAWSTVWNEDLPTFSAPGDAP